jgi:hypothetical protein
MSCASSDWKGTEVRDREKLAWCVIITAAAAFLVACASGCSTSGPGLQAGGELEERASGAGEHE